MKFFILITSLLIFSLTSFSQSITIKGKVVKENSNEPIEFATVVIKDPETQKNITGSSSDFDGNFMIKTEVEKFNIEISVVGFKSKVFQTPTVVQGEINLGEVHLTQDSELLEELVVRGEKSQTEFRLDKRVFNVGKDLSSTGAGALEVLNNVPSVNVNIEGEISLRGNSGVEVLINGKPSVLTSEQGNALGSITADMIDRIEVITNPSAKYDAEGTSGIINIVIKKEERKGTNGSFTVNTGTPHNHSFGLSLNHRTEKFNLFTQLGAGYRELPNDARNFNKNLESDSSIYSTGEEFRNENFYNVVLGTDYYINNRNVVTVSGNFAYEIEDQPSSTQFRLVDELTNTELSRWERNEVTEATNPKWQYEVQYKRDHADDEDHVLLFSALGSYFGKDQSSEFQDITISGAENDGEQQTRTNFEEAENTFKLDYTKPISEKVTLETGTQYVITHVSNDFAVSNLENGIWVEDPEFTNLFEYDQGVFGAYGTIAYEAEKWGIKGGLRLENTDLQTLLVNTNELNEQNFTNLFPSFHTSYKIAKNYSIQAGFSRRVRRPRLWDLNPFFNPRNNFNIRTGNPELRPEFSDSYEISNIYEMKDVSMSFSVYHLYSTDVVERIAVFDNENNRNVIMPFNIGTNRATGVEYNFKYEPLDWLTINGDFNYNYFIREGQLEANSIDFDADRWTSKLNTKFKLPADIDLELTGQYESGFETVQGRMSENYFLDLGARKKIMKGRGVLNLSIRDVFASRIMENFVFQDDFESYSWRQRGRFITFGFSYGFGKGEAMEFSGQKRRFR